MSNVSNVIAENLAHVYERIESAAVAAGRDPAEVQLVGVTKYVDADTTSALLEAGCQNLGESRPQQLWDKARSPALADATWHMIGHLQRNKVRRTVPVVDLIHSVDSLRLAQAIDNVSSELGKTTGILLEVNCSGDEAKHGLVADELRSLLPAVAELRHLEVQGLMTMAAREGGEAVAARNFASLRLLRDQLLSECPPQISLVELSMGMSHDLEVAIAEGATLVRVGSSLFEGLPR